MINITGPRLLIRDWDLQDLELFRQWQIGQHLWKELDAPYYQTSDEEILPGLLIFEKKVLENDFSEPRNKLVVADKKTNLFLGTVNCYWISKETHWLAIGISLFDPKNWGAGLGKEALTLWIDHLFANRPELVRLDLQTWSGNKGMERLALKLGFQLEGRFRKARIARGQHFDSLHFGILRQEWMAIQKQNSN